MVLSISDFDIRLSFHIWHRDVGDDGFAHIWNKEEDGVSEGKSLGRRKKSLIERTSESC